MSILQMNLQVLQVHNVQQSFLSKVLCYRPLGESAVYLNNKWFDCAIVSLCQLTTTCFQSVHGRLMQLLVHHNYTQCHVLLYVLYAFIVAEERKNELFYMFICCLDLHSPALI